MMKFIKAICIILRVVKTVLSIWLALGFAVAAYCLPMMVCTNNILYADFICKAFAFTFPGFVVIMPIYIEDMDKPEFWIKKKTINKTILLALLSLAGIAAEAQMKGDTTKPSEAYMKGNINGTLPIWQEMDAWHVYSYFEDKDRNIWATGRDRSGVMPWEPFSGESVRRDSVPTFNDILFLMQQNKELSDRLDRLEKTMDSLKIDDYQLWGINKLNTRYYTEMFDSLTARIDSLEKRPYIFYDPKGVRPGFYLTNSTGEYQLFVGPLK